MSLGVSKKPFYYKKLSDGRLVVAENGVLIQRNEIEGQSFIHKYGKTDALAKDVISHVWDYSATEEVYTFSDGADINTISSSAVGDTQVVRIYGADIGWNFVTQDVTLDGRNKVTLTTALIRSYRMENFDSTDFAGNIYLYPNTAITTGVPNDTTKVRAYIPLGTNNNTLMAIMPVPYGKKAYLEKWFCTLTGKVAGAVDVRLLYRPFGGVFQVKEDITIMSTGNSGFQYGYKCPLEFNAKGDFAITADADTINMKCSAGFDLLFVDD